MGASVQRSARLTWPSGVNSIGRFELRITTDSDAQIFEHNGAGTGESNNVLLAAVLSSPDLRVANLTATSATAIEAGATVTVAWDDLNAGTAAPIAGWSDRLVVRNLDTGQTYVDTLLAFNPAANGGTPRAGQARARSHDFTLPEGASGAGRSAQPSGGGSTSPSMRSSEWRSSPVARSRPQRSSSGSWSE